MCSWTSKCLEVYVWDFLKNMILGIARRREISPLIVCLCSEVQYYRVEITICAGPALRLYDRNGMRGLLRVYRQLKHLHYVVVVAK